MKNNAQSFHHKSIRVYWGKFRMYGSIENNRNHQSPIIQPGWLFPFFRVLSNVCLYVYVYTCSDVEQKIRMDSLGPKKSGMFYFAYAIYLQFKLDSNMQQWRDFTLNPDLGLFLKNWTCTPKCQERKRRGHPQKGHVLANLKIVPVHFLLFVYDAYLAPVDV